MHEVVSVSGLFFAFSVTEKRVDGMEQMCLQVCDFVTQSENWGFKAWYSASNKYKWEMLWHFIYQPKLRKQLCTGSWEGRETELCVYFQWRDSASLRHLQSERTLAEQGPVPVQPQHVAGGQTVLYWELACSSVATCKCCVLQGHLSKDWLSLKSWKDTAPRKELPLTLHCCPRWPLWVSY